MNITDFPNDIFLLVALHLSPRDLIVNRRVNKQFYAAFTDEDFNHHLLVQHFPRARDVPDSKGNWSDAFSRVAGRYHHLKAGKPQAIQKLALGKSLVVPAWARFYPVAQWQRNLQFEEKTAHFHYPDTLWAYDHGILVYPSAQLQQYTVHDLASGTVSTIDIDSEKKIVRRIALSQRVLVVEWCEPDAYHQLNENEVVHRHFATAYDLRRHQQSGKFEVFFRNEWKIHLLGIPLNSQDRFYSYHTETHYALYIWQPNRSSGGEGEPIEALAIWDISSPSLYRPSEDPKGEGGPVEDLEGPKILRRFSLSGLDFYKIRQRDSPTLRGIVLDENHVYIIQEDHRWIVGQQASHANPRLHKVKSTGIPFVIGPFWEDECGVDGDVNLSFCNRASDERNPRKAPCWRHEEFPYLTITEAVDSKAGVVFSARHCFMLETISIALKPKIHSSGPGYKISLRDDLWKQLLGKGKICGDERWLIGENSESEVVILHFDKLPVTA